jgi:hypothetical protein
VAGGASVMSELVGRSAMDAKLLSFARKSPEEIAELTGLDARFVAERISELLESRDWLSDRQQERLLLEEIADLKDMILERVRFADDKDFAATANVALRTLKLISERLDARKKLVDLDINTIQAAQARLFGKAFDLALGYVVDSFKALEEVPAEEDVDVIVREGLKRAAVELERNVSE